MGRTFLRCAVAAVLIWLSDGLKIFSDMFNPDKPDWVAFMAFAFAMVLLTAPIAIRSTDA
ncbi:MAG TPA: hypothetical protein VFI23_03680 [Rhizomicrobium sp.]|nr:hypothetical protein [Rhizomicrobium sp.]